MEEEPTTKYTILEQPLGTPRPIRIIAIGAGASGINLIHTLRKHLTEFSLTVYDKNAEVGGTWFENRYPGCKCDIPSHNYQFCWSPNPEWKGFYSTNEEIHGYLKKCCEEEGLYDVIQTGRRVEKAVWDENNGIWNVNVVHVVSGEKVEDWCNFLLDGTGILNNWTWPDIPGLHDFHGPVIHSANWPKEFDYKDKTVAVIGNGATGVQIVPAILPDVKHVVHVVRSQSWIVPPGLINLSMSKAASVLGQIEMDKKGKFTEMQIQKFKDSPEKYLKFVKAIELETNQNFTKFTIKESEGQVNLRGRIEQHMRMALKNNEKLCKAMIPDFPVGCRRITPGDGYLEALISPQVTVITDAVTSVDLEGLITSTGKQLKVDAIICATGFNASFIPRFPIIGRGGRNLQDQWSHNLPQAYMSCAVANMPNYFIFLGPNAPIGHGSYFTITEQIAKFIARVIKKCQTQSIRSIVPSQEAVDDFSEHIQVFMPRTTWSGSCRSWYKQGKMDGPVTALHPGSRIHFFDMLSDFRGEDWEYTYEGKGRKNRFAYLGNGISKREMDGSDCAWYIDQPDKL